MTTLREYAEQEYPNHAYAGVNDDAPLPSHTTVAHVLGAHRTGEVERALREHYTDSSTIGVVLVERNTSSVVSTGGEDVQSVADLPKRRVAVGAVLGAVVVGVVLGVIAALIVNVAAGVIAGVFGLGIGAWLGGLLSGGGRYAGARAWSQTNAPDSTVGLVAVFLHDEPSAVAAANLMSGLGPEDVRVLDDRGGWHSPNTYRTES